MISLQRVPDFYKCVADLTDSMSRTNASERKGLRKRLEEVQRWLGEPQLSFTAQDFSDLQPETWQGADRQV